jgi:hypothetical protein
MKKFLPFMLAVLSSVIANGHMTAISHAGADAATGRAYVGEPVANDDISDNNFRGFLPGQ